MNRYRTFTILFALFSLSLTASAQVVGTFRIDQDRQQGTHPNGQLLLYSPDPLEPGSSMSHWETLATPNLLMEPFVSTDLDFLDLDITPDAMADMGWQSGTSNFRIFPVQDPGLGFEDPTPFPGAPGNPATTLGEARQNLFNAVLGAWGNTLESSVPIDVTVVWTDLFCDPDFGATLGAASTTVIFRGVPFPGTPIDEDTWIPAALAEALTGEQLTGDPDTDGTPDVFVLLNQAIDTQCLGPDTGFYYGLDNQLPAGLINVGATLLHEFGHGIGFANFTDEADGQLFEGFPSVFDHLVHDQFIDKGWDEMTDAERVASATRPRQVTWTGANANQEADELLDSGVPELFLSEPNSLDGSIEVGLAGFGPEFPPTPLQGEIVCMLDEAGALGTTLDGCSSAINPDELAGKIALIDRGSCSFAQKVKNAQDAGATAAIIVNNSGDTPVTLGGVDDTITIPSVGIGSGDGARIRAEACAENANYFLNGRFQVSAQWTVRGETAPAEAVALTEESGYFYFFSPTNIEITVKMLDACSVPGLEGHWLFAAGMTDVGVELTVIDTDTGQTVSYSNPEGTPFVPIIDNQTFTDCP